MAQRCPPGQVTQAHQAAVHRDAAALCTVPHSQQPLLDDHLATQGQHGAHIPLLLLQADDQVLVEGGGISQEGPEGALDLQAWCYTVCSSLPSVQAARQVRLEHVEQP